MSLTVKKVVALIAAGRPGRYHDLHNLVLQVFSPTSASWLFRYQRSGRKRAMGLGPVHTVTLAEARERALAARRLLLEGIDPLEARAAERATRALEAAKAMTFEAAVKKYYAAHEDSWSSAKHRRFFLNSLSTYVLPKIGALPVNSIDTALVLGCIEPIWSSKAITANRLRAWIEAILDWASVRGFRSGDNPARWRGHLSKSLPAPSKVARTAHRAALPAAELPAFMAELAQQEGVPARALEFLILTAARTAEVIRATWTEIDLDNKNQVWTIPAERMKTSREHRVPLTPRMCELLRVLPREGDYVFMGMRAGDHIGPLAMSRVLKRLRPDVDVHGFRSTFSDWAHEHTAFDNHTIEQSLAHQVGSGVERAYRRGDMFDKRRKLMEAWSAYCSSPPTLKTSDVVPLRGRRK
jgi:integrase